MQWVSRVLTPAWVSQLGRGPRAGQGVAEQPNVQERSRHLELSAHASSSPKAVLPEHSCRAVGELHRIRAGIEKGSISGKSRKRRRERKIVPGFALLKRLHVTLVKRGPFC